MKDIQNPIVTGFVAASPAWTAAMLLAKAAINNGLRIGEMIKPPWMLTSQKIWLTMTSSRRAT